jgi:hypothetical protein
LLIRYAAILLRCTVLRFLRFAGYQKLTCSQPCLCGPEKKGSLILCVSLCPCCLKDPFVSLMPPLDLTSTTPPVLHSAILEV